MITAPSEIKGPKGTVLPTVSLFVESPMAMTGKARKKARKSAMRTLGPRKIPIIAPNLMSPPPMLSFLKIEFPNSPTHHKNPPPKNNPDTALMMGIWLRKIDEHKPMIMPGKVSTFKINLVSRSMILIGKRNKNKIE